MRKLYAVLVLSLLNGCAITTEQLKARYKSGTSFKAMAIADNDRSGAAWGQASTEKAIDLALMYCAKSGGNNCKIVSIDNYSFNRPAKKRETPSPTFSVRYTCSELGKGQAYRLLLKGHSYLDRDGDGHPCEWDSKTYKVYTPKTSYSSSRNCHWVNRYRRSDGTYVRGHSRCR